MPHSSTKSRYGLTTIYRVSYRHIHNCASRYIHTYIGKIYLMYVCMYVHANRFVTGSTMLACKFWLIIRGIQHCNFVLVAYKCTIFGTGDAK